MKKPSMLKRLSRSQKGFTLVELMIVIALTGIISTAAAMSIHQVLTGTALSNDLNTAINQVRNAGYWISRDAQMAQSVDHNPGDPKFFELTWTDWDDSELHTISYSLESIPAGLNKLKRSETDNNGTTQTFIAQHIKSKEEGVTWCQWDGEVLTVTITAQVGGKTETRTFQVKPRPD